MLVSLFVFFHVYDGKMCQVSVGPREGMTSAEDPAT
jgi:hypothetical protein